MKKDGYKVMMTQKKIRGIDESASKLAMGIAGFTGTRGVAVDDFIHFSYKHLKLPTILIV